MNHLRRTPLDPFLVRCALQLQVRTRTKLHFGILNLCMKRASKAQEALKREEVGRKRKGWMVECHSRQARGGKKAPGERTDYGCGVLEAREVLGEFGHAGEHELVQDGEVDGERRQVVRELCAFNLS